jgi:hypothetical protein
VDDVLDVHWLVVLGEQLGDQLAAAGDADLLEIAFTWSRTVWADRNSSSAMSPVAAPRAIRRVICCSRSVSS